MTLCYNIKRHAWWKAFCYNKIVVNMKAGFLLTFYEYKNKLDIYTFILLAFKAKYDIILIKLYVYMYVKCLLLFSTKKQIIKHILF